AHRFVPGPRDYSSGARTGIDRANYCDGNGYRAGGRHATDGRTQHVGAADAAITEQKISGSDYSHAENQDQPNRRQALHREQERQGQIQTRVRAPYVFGEESETEGAPAQDRNLTQGRRRKSSRNDAVRLSVQQTHTISIKEGLHSDASRQRRTQDAPPS